MKPILALLLLALAATGALAAAAADLGYKAQFVGGTLPGVAPKSPARLVLTGPDVLVFECRGQTLNISYLRFNGLEYGQTVSRRYAAAVLISPIFLFTKSRQHYITIGYTDPDGKQQALVFRVNKGDIRGVLTALEARSGRRIEYQDDEARKAGK
jgi:hypothetical protein